MNNDTIVTIQALIEAVEEKRWDFAYLWMLTTFSPYYNFDGFDRPSICKLR
jgi:hypothetical protein